VTQLDLPQISLQRYVDLLRRRRWQVIPVSVLGLLVGGFVALLIPRYYVADTVVQYTRAPGEPTPGPGEDPMAEAVDNAKHTIPQAVGETIKQLGWEDYAGLGLFAAHEYEHTVRSRIDILDQNAGRPVRSFAQLHITYRDQDGQRAAAFLNGLVLVWKNRQLQSMRDNTQAMREVATRRFDAATMAYEATSAEIANLEKSRGMPAGLSGQEESEYRLKTEEAKARKKIEVNELQLKVTGLRNTLDNLNETQNVTPQKVPLSKIAAHPGARDTPLTRQIADLTEKLKKSELNLMAVIAKGHPDYASRLRERDLLTTELAKLLGSDPGSEVLNPDWTEQQKSINARTLELQLLEPQLKDAKDTLADLDRRLEDMAGVFRDLRNIGMRLADNVAERDAAHHELEHLNTVLAQLTNRQPIEVTQPAIVPPKPTEPNVLVVAGLGCLIGLGVAIGLILLVDFLQGTFKTVEDVERAMPVPVLGGFAHLQTEEVRQRAQKSRRFASLVGGTVLVLILTMVTIYYLDPTRLPAFARNVLALVLG
jgi:uncharacterized protein involved in exopolysaccharide biosynthesis